MFVFEDKFYVIADFQAVEQRFFANVKFHYHRWHHADYLFVIELDRDEFQVNLCHFAATGVIAVFWGCLVRSEPSQQAAKQ